MSVSTDFERRIAADRKFAVLDDLAASVLITLRQFSYGHADETAQRRLRERLQLFNDEVINAANAIIANHVD